MLTSTSVLNAPAALHWRQLAILLAGRLVLNTAFRIVYPLLAFLAHGLAVDLRTASLLVTVQVAASMISPLGGRLADARGERATMSIGLALFCLGAAACALARSFVPFLLGYGLIGLATALYHPSAQAYASARTPYARRGQILGILELTWALAALVGVATLSPLIERADSWWPAFVILLIAGVVVLVGTALGLPDAERPERKAQSTRASIAPLLQRHVVAILALAFLCTIASELVFVVYAGWLQQSFAATTEQIGLVFGSLGFVELAGSGGATLLVDRLGKRRAVLLGFAGTAIFQALLPVSSGHWILFLPLFLLFDLCFEFAIVASFPLISGVLPMARGTMLALGVTSIGLGRVVGSLLGPPLWERFGFAANGLLAAGLTLLGVAIGILMVREGEE